METASGSRTADDTALFTLRDLRVDRGDRRVLDGFDLEVRRGEVFGLLGPNGAGKSTAFQAIAGLLPASEGTVELAGEAMPMGDARLRARMGVVFQSPALDGRLSARINLCLAGGLYGLTGRKLEGRVTEMVEFADLAGRDREPVKKLSGGMRRRLELARALIHEPEFLLMDEPTTGLDEASYKRTWDVLKSLAKEKGVAALITTHRAEEAALCDRLAFLSAGKIVTTGAPSDLRDQVGGDVIELECADPEESADALGQALGVQVEIAGGRLRIVADRGHELVPRLVEALPAGTFESIGIHRPGLSDVFLSVTGRNLAEDEG